MQQVRTHFSTAYELPLLTRPENYAQVRNGRCRWIVFSDLLRSALGFNPEEDLTLRCLVIWQLVSKVKAPLSENS